MKARFFAFFIFFTLILSLQAQRNARFEAYVEQFAPIAMEQMRQHGVPASITLAQGLLESGAGSSRLATQANNHFGIKTGSDWTGPYMLKDDDAPNEQFRVYTDAMQSYEDHSLFLRKHSRYASLFTLEPDDYRGWARGLKAAGYATSPTYADRLIQIIETYGLARFDRPDHAERKEPTYTLGTPATTTVEKVLTPSKTSTTLRATRQTATSTPKIQMQNGAYYVIAQHGDTYRTIGKRWGVRAGSLLRYNEQQKGHEPQVGERVYLVKKPARAEKRYKGQYHIVQSGQSVHAIAQAYGMRMHTLYRLNRLPGTYTPRCGDRLLLR